MDLTQFLMKITKIERDRELEHLKKQAHQMYLEAKEFLRMRREAEQQDRLNNDNRKEETNPKEED